MKRNREQGFSLIELLVAVVIASILLVISIPAYKSIRNGARNDAAEDALKAAVALIKAEITAKKGKAPALDELIADPAAGTPTFTKGKMQALWSPETHVFRYQPISKMSGSKRLGNDEFKLCVGSTQYENPTVYTYDSQTGIYGQEQATGTLKYGDPFNGTACP